MNEKKLTDEEIVKALSEYAEKNYEHCSYAEYVQACGVYCNHKKEFIADMGGKNGEDCSTCDMIDIVETAIVAKQTLDLIHRLQAEKERLTEENRVMKHNMDFHRNKKFELQKQVEELKKQSLLKCDCCPARRDLGLLLYQNEQAVKDTAKEIYTQMLEWIPIGEGYSTFIDNFEMWIKERYGVEVE